MNKEEKQVQRFCRYEKFSYKPHFIHSKIMERFLQFHSSFSRLLWLFEVFCISIQIVKLFVLVL